MNGNPPKKTVQTESFALQPTGSSLLYRPCFVLLWTLYKIPNLLSNTAKVIQRNTTMIWTKPRNSAHLTLKKLKVSVGRRFVIRWRILKDMEDEAVVTTKQHRSLYKNGNTVIWIQILMEDTRENISHVSLEMRLLPDLTPRMLWLGMVSIETSDMTKSPYTEFISFLILL